MANAFQEAEPRRRGSRSDVRDRLAQRADRSGVLDALARRVGGDQAGDAGDGEVHGFGKDTEVVALHRDLSPLMYNLPLWQHG